MLSHEPGLSVCVCFHDVWVRGGHLTACAGGGGEQLAFHWRGFECWQLKFHSKRECESGRGHWHCPDGSQLCLKEIWIYVKGGVLDVLYYQAGRSDAASTELLQSRTHHNDWAFYFQKKQRLIIICMLTLPKLQITALRLQSVMLCQCSCPTRNKSQTIAWTIVMLTEWKEQTNTSIGE